MAKQVLQLFGERREDLALELIAEQLLSRRKIGFDGGAYLRRAAAVVRHSRLDVRIPDRIAVGAGGERGRILYLAHMRAPLINNGYVARTQLMLRSMRNAGYSPVAMTRLGFPADLKAFRDSFPAPVESIDDTEYHLLEDTGGGLQRRPIDDYIRAYSRCIAAQALDLRPRAIHAASNFVNGLAGVSAARLLGLPSIYEVRGLWELTKAAGSETYERSYRFEMERRLELQAIREADRVITISQSLKAYLVDLGASAEKMVVVPNGVDLEEIAARRCEAPLDFGWPKGSIVIGYVGSLVRYEGIDLVLKAVAKLRREGDKRLRVLIVGDGSMLDELRLLARELELGDSVAFTGRLGRQRALACYEMIDIAPFARYDFPVTRLIPPIKPMEAMATGTCVLVSDVPALSENISPGLTGIIFKAGDLDDLAAQIAALAADRDKRRLMGQNARQWVGVERSLQSISERIAEAYAGLDIA